MKTKTNNGCLHKCFICGQWFVSINSHLILKHKVKPDENKIKEFNEKIKLRYGKQDEN